MTGLFFFKSNKDNNVKGDEDSVLNETDYEKENKIYEVNNEKNEFINKLTFTYNGKTLTYPFTLKDMENIGVIVDEENKEKKIVANTGMGNINVYVENYKYENEITLVVSNDTFTEQSSEDCVITYIDTHSIYTTVNGITPGKSNYMDILERFGRDDQKRKNTFYNENLRQKLENNLDNQMSYSSRDNKSNLYSLDIVFETDNNQLVDRVVRVTYTKY